jgi:2-iminobutanoate/2-iminopropanoate deaminase
MRFISSADAPAPGGHYSQAVESNGLIFVSGILPVGSDNGAEPASFEAQTDLALTHCEHVLAAAGLTFADVVQCTAYIVGIGNWPLFNQVYAKRFGSHKPARAVVPVPELHHGFLVEVALTAERRA